MGVQAKKVTHITATMRETLSFDDLWLGDRFQPVGSVGEDQPVYTKIRHDQARCHSVETVQLGKDGFGQLSDAIVKVEKNERVRYTPFRS